MKTSSMDELSERLAAPLQVIASPRRMAILLTIGRGEACVCHLEARLGWRQAYISQHLMALRKGGILRRRRAGRFVYYSLKNDALLDLIYRSATLAGLSAEVEASIADPSAAVSCECPHCLPAVIQFAEREGDPI